MLQRAGISVRLHLQESAGLPGADVSLVTAASNGLERFMQVDSQVIALYRRGDQASRTQADGLVLGQEITLFNAAADELNTFADQLAKEQATAAAGAESNGTSATRLTIGVGLGVVLFVLVAFYLVGISFRKPLIQLAVASDKLAVGDFDFTVDTDRQDEGGRALAALDRMKTALTSLLAQMSTMTTEHDKGDIDVRIDTQQFAGGYTVARGVNDMVDGHVASKRVSAPAGIDDTKFDRF